MLDWKPGDTLVCIHVPTVRPEGCTLPDLVLGKFYTMKQLWVDTQTGACNRCDSFLMLHLEEAWDKEWAYCPCCFRKPIDFSELLNVKQVKIKVLEDV
jgi:hypothetical protein